MDWLDITDALDSYDDYDEDGEEAVLLGTCECGWSDKESCNGKSEDSIVAAKNRLFMSHRTNRPACRYALRYETQSL